MKRRVLTLFLFTLGFINIALPVNADDNQDAPRWQHLSSQQIADALNWVRTPDSHTLCRGYYLENSFDDTLALNTKETTITADGGVLNQKGPSILKGNVIVTQPNRRLTADRAEKESDLITITGDVRMNQPGILATANKATINSKTNATTLNDNIFRFQIMPGQETVIDQQKQIKVVHIEGKNYRGQASVMQQIHPKLVELDDAALTTCNPFDKTWVIAASKFYLNQETGLGDAYNARLLFYGVPIFYTPYFRFPIDNRRRTGFLAPQFSVSGRAGTTVSTPFYINLAPNYDMTLYPSYYSNRGLQLGSAFRYLTDDSNGQLYFSQIDNDRLFAQNQANFPSEYNQPAYANEINRLIHSSDDRQQFIWNDNTQYNANWSSQANINYVSDDYYLQDFGNAPITPNDPFADLYPTTQLPQTLSVTYASRHITVTTSMDNYQTLHPVTLPATNDQYARLPEVDADVNYPNSLLNLDYDLPTQYVEFATPWFEPNWQVNLPNQNGNVIGARYNAQPSVGYYDMQPWGYIHPMITLNGTAYELANTNPNSLNPAEKKMNTGFTVPLYDLDTGLYFDRQVSVGTQDYTQTLEPRLYYLYVPYVNQNNFPLFDTSANTSWTYNSLFSNDRFIGVDRIGDTNQVSLGLTSRLINNTTGNDLLDVSVGQLFYLENRQVQLTPLTPPDTYKTSPLVAQLLWQLNQYWNSTDNVAYNENLNTLESANIGFNYVADNQHLLSFGYSLIKPINENTNQEISGTISQWNIGSTWQFTPHWQLYGAINYNDINHFIQTYLYGVQYNNCCWSIRALNSRSFIGFQPDGVTPLLDNAFYLQFTFTGLSSISSGNAQTLLQTGIPNYVDDFGQQKLTIPAL